MANHNLGEKVMSESIEMYLLRVALLQQNEQPVPIPQLAQELSIAPVSAHEMCRKLTDKGLVQYEPYKGVTLTAQGEALAQRVLRCRRLWEVFFVEKLGIEPQEAEEMACRFEHVTPDALAERLAIYLKNPIVSPQNAPIPYGNGASVKHPTRPLTSLAAGGRGQVVDITTEEATKEFLRRQGLFPGIVVEVLAVAEDGSMLLDVSGQHLSLSQMLASGVDVT
jgi:DtxR family Mn-dependent transcriptional regulator